MTWTAGPPEDKTTWQKIKFWVWYNLYYKWWSKYRWWIVKRGLLNGKLIPKIKTPYRGLTIEEIVCANQMTAQPTVLKWKWYKKVGPGDNYVEIDPPGENK